MDKIHHLRYEQERLKLQPLLYFQLDFFIYLFCIISLEYSIVIYTTFHGLSIFLWTTTTDGKKREKNLGLFNFDHSFSTKKN